MPRALIHIPDSPIDPYDSALVERPRDPNEPAPCDACEGSSGDCAACDGSGADYRAGAPCVPCSGSGDCPTCGGEGHVEDCRTGRGRGSSGL